MIPQDGKDPAADNGNLPNNIETFPEQESIERGAEAVKESMDSFKTKQTYENLSAAIPRTIEIGEKKKELTINISLFDRICTEQVNMDISSGPLKSNFSKYGEEFFPGVNFQSIPESGIEVYRQQLAIIVACHDKSIIHLNKKDTKELCNLLLPLVSKSKVRLAEKGKEEDEKVEENISFADDPAGPLFIRLRAEGIISEVEFQALNLEYEKKGSFKNIDFAEHSETIQDFLAKATGTEKTTTEANTRAFLGDFKNMKVGIAEIDVVDDITAKIISESYVQIRKPGEDSNNKWKDYSTAIEVAKNKLLLNDYSVDRNSETFKKAIRQIESGIPINQYLGLQTIIALKGMAPGKFANIEKQNKRTRMEELLIKSHNQGLQQVEDRIEKAKLARKLGEEEEEGEQDGQEDISIDTEIDAIPGGIKEIEIPEEGNSSPSQ